MAPIASLPTMFASSVNLIPEAPVSDLVHLGVLAEELGYDRCWVYDEGLATRDVYVTLTAIAARTTRIRLGTGSTHPYTRHPATTAATIASLDELSSGRAFLGVGAGGSLTLGPLAIERTHPLQSVSDLLAACRGLLDGDVVNMTTPGFELRNARLGFPCRRGIEIWLAGRGPKMLALGGRRADGVMLDFINKPDIGQSVELVRSAARSAGRNPRICYSTMVITDDAAMAQTKPHMTYRLVDSPPAIKELLGISPHDVDQIRSAMADGLEAAAQYVRDEWVLPFVIAGSVQECAQELAELVNRHGIDEFLLPVLDLHQAEPLMRAVADVVGRAR